MADKILHKRRHFNVNIPFENSEPVIVKILLEIKPEWSKEKLEFKYFTEGISNKLIGCMLQCGSEKDLIMFRLYGNRTELFIDRQQELVNVEFLHSRGFAPKLYATFENGYCCGFIPGRTLETEEMSDKHLSALIARKLARVHAIELPSYFETGEPCAFSMIEKFLSVLPDKFDDNAKQTRYEKEIRNKVNVVDELKLLKDKLSNSNVPLVYCHNDLLVKNIINNKEDDDVSFIDYEYGAYNYSAFDIGNHFNEFGGVVIDPDYSLYPNKDFQLKWLRIYLEEKAKVQGTGDVITEEQLEKLYVQVNQFALVSHLFWGVWALLQANFSSIDFDFLLAHCRKLSMRKIMCRWGKLSRTRDVITEEQLEKLYVQVNQFALVSHLFWGVWALLQANFSSIDFDFLLYSRNRLYEYLRRKDEFLNL